MNYASLRKQLEQQRPDLDLATLDRTVDFSERVHEGMFRLSGEPYLSHPVEMAAILLPLEPDLLTLQAVFLHDVLEDTPVTVEQLTAEFGPEVARLVEGLERLALVKVPTPEAGVAHAESWKNLFLGLSTDVRLIFVKLADRLHNLRTLQFLPFEKRERIARESLLVHAGIASRLGLYGLKSELEDLSFAALYPVEYAWLQSEVLRLKGESESTMAAARQRLEGLLKAEGVEFVEIQGRFKHLWSIFQKMENKEKALADIYDLFAMRVILPDFLKDEREDTAHLYSVLSLLHREFEPLPDRMKDYVVAPKVNGYRSIHVTVLGLADTVDQPVEVQIRTERMHHESELGVASHWNYKLGQRGASQAVDQVRQAFTQATESGRLELEFFPERVFVLTPTRQVLELPRGATPVDFAYLVHSEVGDHMIGAKVNGAIVPLNYELHSGDLVEIVTRSNAAPTLNWLAFAKSHNARNKIRGWFRRREEANLEAQDLQVAQAAAEAEATPQPKHEAGSYEEFLIKEDAQRVGILGQNVLVTGQDKLPVVLSACCQPRPPHRLVGYVTRGQSIRVHRLSCRELEHLDTARFIECSWK